LKFFEVIVDHVDCLLAIPYVGDDIGVKHEDILEECFHRCDNKLHVIGDQDFSVHVLQRRVEILLSQCILVDLHVRCKVLHDLLDDLWQLLRSLNFFFSQARFFDLHGVRNLTPERKEKGAAQVKVRLNPNFASQALHNSLANAEAHAGSFRVHVFVCTEHCERSEQLFLVFWTNAASRVLHFDCEITQFA